MTLSAKARELLDGANYLSVATLNPDGSPQTTLVWGRLDGEDLIFSTIKGRQKFRNLSRDPRVSVLVFDPANPFSTVEVRGEASLTEDPEGTLIEELSQRYTGKAWVEANPEAERVIVRIQVRKVLEH